jgi:hypothetical protein
MRTACFEKLEEKNHFKGPKGWRFEGLHLPSFEDHHVQVQIEYEENIEDFFGCT